VHFQRGHPDVAEKFDLLDEFIHFDSNRALDPEYGRQGPLCSGWQILGRTGLIMIVARFIAIEGRIGSTDWIATIRSNSSTSVSRAHSLCDSPSPPQPDQHFAVFERPSSCRMSWINFKQFAVRF
jgi:hypothetical protein